MRVTPIPVPVVDPIPTASDGVKYSSLLKNKTLVVLAAPILAVNLLGSEVRIDVAVCADDTVPSCFLATLKRFGSILRTLTLSLPISRMSFMTRVGYCVGPDTGIKVLIPVTVESLILSVKTKVLVVTPTLYLPSN